MFGTSLINARWEQLPDTQLEGQSHVVLFVHHPTIPSQQCRRFYLFAGVGMLFGSYAMVGGVLKENVWFRVHRWCEAQD